MDCESGRLTRRVEIDCRNEHFSSESLVKACRSIQVNSMLEQRSERSFEGKKAKPWCLSLFEFNEQVEIALGMLLTFRIRSKKREPCHVILFAKRREFVLVY